MGGQVGDLVVPGHGVDGGVDFHAMRMGELHRPGQLLVVKIARKGAHAEAGACQIHGIGTVTHRHVEPLHVSCGAE